MDQISPLTLDELETLERLLDRVAEATLLPLIGSRTEKEPHPLLDAIAVVAQWVDDEATARERQQMDEDRGRLHEWRSVVGA